MADSDREKWNSRYIASRGKLTPSTLVTAHYKSTTVGRALDIACGNGRNSLFLADKGFTVDAVDISSVAIEGIVQQNPTIIGMCQDIDYFTPEIAHYELIININFLDRRLFPLIEKALKPGGVLIFESFSGKKTSRYCLGPNELLHSFPSLHISYYEEKNLEDSEKFDTGISYVAMKKA